MLTLVMPQPPVLPKLLPVTAGVYKVRLEEVKLQKKCQRNTSVYKVNVYTVYVLYVIFFKTENGGKAL